MYVARYYIGSNIKPGDILPEMPAETIERLLKRGAISKKETAPLPSPVSDGQDINAAEGVVKKKAGRRSR